MGIGTHEEASGIELIAALQSEVLWRFTPRTMSFVYKTPMRRSTFASVRLSN